MKKILCFVLCIIVLISGFLVSPASAIGFYVSHYEEAIYAGGVVDLYAYPSVGDTEDYTYQWQFDAGLGDGHWYDVPDNESYSGGKTNHLRMYTSTGNYDGWEEVPFQCLVTASDGTVRWTNDIFMHIYPTDKLIPNMKNWGYGLYTPTVTNVIDFYTKDEINYTASTYAGTTLKIFCGSKPVDDKPVLRKSEVELKTEIHITENGNTTISSNNTSYIPYTVGTLQVQIKEKLTIGGHDLGYFDTKTIDITVAKPILQTTGQTKSDCFLLRYPYNESQKLVSIPKGTTVEIVGSDSSYYQVYYNGCVGYVGKSLISANENSDDRVITTVDVTLTMPIAGQTPATTCTVDTPSCELYHTDPVTWTDASTGKLMKATDTFVEGKQYTVSIWLAAKSGYRFQLDASGNPKLSGAINGNLPPFIHKAYEQDPEKVIELSYTFGNTPKGEEHSHTISDWRTTGIYHYKVCTTCGELLETEDHYGGTATCMEDGICTVCGYAYLEASEDYHLPDTGRWVARMDWYHYHPCVYCGAHCDIEDHRWSPTYLYKDKTGHAWICADCGGKSEIEPHNPGPAATQTAPQTCKDCGYILEPAVGHVHELTLMPYVPPTCLATGTVEHYACSGCTARFADKNGKEPLAEDFEVIIPYLTHVTSDEWYMDEQFHWRCCSLCGIILSGTQMVHEFEKGKCATCGYAQGSGATTPVNDPVKPTTPTQPTQPTSGSETTGQEGSDAKGGISWVILTVVALVCAGGAATIAAIMLKKKK